MKIEDLKPIEDSEDSYSGYSRERLQSRKYEIDYNNLICCDCKKNKASLIRGTDEYLCVDCFKKWLEDRKK